MRSIRVVDIITGVRVRGPSDRRLSSHVGDSPTARPSAWVLATDARCVLLYAYHYWRHDRFPLEWNRLYTDVARRAVDDHGAGGGHVHPAPRPARAPASRREGSDDARLCIASIITRTSTFSTFTPHH
ncbi:hypothetical protein EVAR_46492_1 [Eumeta japonica]|uniref:Uncharacterized protein n=1 Tax=Eumeta variegata TaxID=151549 RepID=A0A4C1WVI8_EUMVA|nr:hypothetical protein EVAR_46492_1 [Eumeta japonica]